MGDVKKIAEKHVFGNSGFSRYSETDVAETLRSSGGDMGGLGKYRDFCGFAIGFDDFNLAQTFGKTMTLQASRADTDHPWSLFGVKRNERE